MASNILDLAAINAHILEATRKRCVVSFWLTVHADPENAVIENSLF